MQVTPTDFRVYAAAKGPGAEIGGDIANSTDIVPVIQGAWLRVGEERWIDLTGWAAVVDGRTAVSKHLKHAFGQSRSLAARIGQRQLLVTPLMHRGTTARRASAPTAAAPRAAKKPSSGFDDIDEDALF